MILPFALLTLSPTAALAQQIRQRETTSFERCKPMIGRGERIQP